MKDKCFIHWHILTTAAHSGDISYFKGYKMLLMKIRIIYLLGNRSACIFKSLNLFYFGILGRQNQIMCLWKIHELGEMFNSSSVYKISVCQRMFMIG
jgi:hypothetical protein